MVGVGTVVSGFGWRKSSGDDCVMKHVKITAFDCPDAWFQALSHIWSEGDVFKEAAGQ
jgi:hypothetical protein